jgi:hypothetical protein
MNMMLLVLSLIAATTPTASNPQPGARSEGNQFAQATKPKNVAEAKYCIAYEDVTGSRTSGGKVCQTKAQWAADGIDVDNPAKDQ